MNTAQQLEKAITQLTPEQYSELRDWFIQYESKNWDDQIKTDIQSGKLRFLENEALREHSSKQTRKL